MLEYFKVMSLNWRIFVYYWRVPSGLTRKHQENDQQSHGTRSESVYSEKTETKHNQCTWHHVPQGSHHHHNAVPGLIKPGVQIWRGGEQQVWGCVYGIIISPMLGARIMKS